MFDSGCGMQFDDSPHGASFLLEAANDVDYYVIYGPEMDDVISGYRHITGKVQWMPKYLFGYIQSKERYKTQDERGAGSRSGIARIIPASGAERVESAPPAAGAPWSDAHGAHA